MFGSIFGGGRAVVAPGAPHPVLASDFADLVAEMDRTAQADLGGVSVIYQPESGDPVMVSGIYDAMYVLAKGDAEAGVETLGPAVFLRLEDLPVDPEQDDPIITIGGAVYRVTERRPDDLGGIVLALRLVT